MLIWLVLLCCSWSFFAAFHLTKLYPQHQQQPEIDSEKTEKESEIGRDRKRERDRVENLIAAPKAVMVVSYNLWPVGRRWTTWSEHFHCRRKMPSKVPTLSTWLLKCIQPKSRNCQTKTKPKKSGNNNNDYDDVAKN